METPNEMQMKIVDKATGDADFRARLLSDPKGAIGQELGVTMPASLSIEVHEESGTTAHLVLPPRQQAGRKRSADGRRRLTEPSKLGLTPRTVVAKGIHAAGCVAA